MKHAKTLGQQWHEQAQRHWKRDSLIVACVCLVIMVATMAYSVWRNDQAVAQAMARQIEVQQAEKAAREREAWIFSEAEAHARSVANARLVKEQLDALKAEDEAERILAEEAAYQEWLWQQSQYVPPAYSAPVEVPEAASDGMTWQEFQFQGVVYDDEGHLYTYYSERVLPGAGLTELNENGRHSEDGFVKDGDGYIAVASSSHEKGEVVDTPFGKGKVYDTGYLQDGQIDVYVSF